MQCFFFTLTHLRCSGMSSALNIFSLLFKDGRTIPVSTTQPAVLQTTVESNPQVTSPLNNVNAEIQSISHMCICVTPACVWPLHQASVAAGQAELLRQQAELEKKAAELERKEQELRDRDPSQGEPSLLIWFCMSFWGHSHCWHEENCALTGKQNNWPPLPRFFPIKPCFYQDFNEEIPVEFQRVCKMMYYLWMCKWCLLCWDWCSVLNVVVTFRNVRLFPDHSVTLFLNLLACLACFTVFPENGVDFGLSILWFILFTPGAFLCWYRPVYKAFRWVDFSIKLNPILLKMVDCFWP